MQPLARKVTFLRRVAPPLEHLQNIELLRIRMTRISKAPHQKGDLPVRIDRPQQRAVIISRGNIRQRHVAQRELQRLAASSRSTARKQIGSLCQNDASAEGDVLVPRIGRDVLPQFRGSIKLLASIIGNRIRHSAMIRSGMRWVLAIIGMSAVGLLVWRLLQLQESRGGGDEDD